MYNNTSHTGNGPSHEMTLIHKTKDAIEFPERGATTGDLFLGFLLLPVEPWTSHWASLNFSFFTHEMSMMVISSLLTVL